MAEGAGVKSRPLCPHLSKVLPGQFLRTLPAVHSSLDIKLLYIILIEIEYNLDAVVFSTRTIGIEKWHCGSGIVPHPGFLRRRW